MDFFQQYFINPIIYGTGYNIYNTVSYGIIAVLVLAGTLKLLETLKIKIDEKFFLALSPFILLGPLLRSMYDIHATNSILFVTPMVYVVVWILAFAAISISLLISKKTKIPYYRTMFVLGVIPCVWAATYFLGVSPIPLAQVAALTLGFELVLFSIQKFKQTKFLTPINSAIILTHLFDASTTFVAVNYYGFGEEHVLAGMFMGILGNYGIFALKLLVIPFVLYILDKEVKEKNPNSFAKLCIFILGAGPGLRNLLSVMMAS